jgi:hypothetical protein
MRDMWQINISTVQMKINNKIKETSFLSSAFFLIPNLPFPLFIHVCCKMHKLKEFILHVSLIFFWLISFFQISIKINNRRILLLNSQFLSPLISSSFVSKWRSREMIAIEDWGRRRRDTLFESPKRNHPFQFFTFIFPQFCHLLRVILGKDFGKKNSHHFAKSCEQILQERFEEVKNQW